MAILTWFDNLEAPAEPRNGPVMNANKPVDTVNTHQLGPGLAR